MIKLVFIWILMLPIICSAQSDYDRIKDVVQLYIDGTSYNYPEKLEQAFHKDISMYFAKKDSPHFMPSRDEYIGYFETDNPGSFTGRKGEITLVDIDGDIAFAKAEIFIPSHELLFTDYFFIKKINNQWKIMSKTAWSRPVKRQEKKILFVTSNARFYGDSDIVAANHLGEIVIPYDEFRQAGYQIDIVSPNGGDIPIGYLWDNYELIEPYLFDAEFMYKLKNTQKPSDINSEDYSAIFYSGGGSSMFGTHDHPGINEIARQIYEEGQGILSSICHGTAGIVNIKLSNGNYAITKKDINGFPDSFERKDSKYYKQFPFSINEAVENRGGKFLYADEMSSGYFIVDGRIVTGQDSASASAMARQIIQLLKTLKK